MNIKKRIQASISVKEKILSDKILLKKIEKIANICVTTFQNDGKVLFCGNGGSAADAQHLAAELSGRFYLDRPPLFAEAMHVNTSFLTAMANDYNYDEAFARMVQAAGKKSDVLIALSTSGNSTNILKAVEQANQLGMTTIVLTGSSGGKIGKICDITFNVPSKDTPRIQEAHIMVGHVFCEIIEQQIFGENQ